MCKSALAIYVARRSTLSITNIYVLFASLSFLCRVPVACGIISKVCSRETRDAIQGTMANHDKPQISTVSREDFIIKCVARGILTDRLNMSLESYLMGAINMGQNRVVCFVLKNIGHRSLPLERRGAIFRKELCRGACSRPRCRRCTHARKQSGRSHARQTELRLNIARDLEETTERYNCFVFRAECCYGGTTKSTNTQGITPMPLFAMREGQKGHE